MIHCKSLSQGSSSVTFPDMTALLDVIFILLVFLLLTANAVPKVLDVSLPEKGSDQSHTLEMREPVTITLFSQEGRWGLDGKEFSSWPEFEATLLKQVSSEQVPQIIIAGDKDTSLEKTLQVFAWLQGHDLKAAQIMMQPD